MNTDNPSFDRMRPHSLVYATLLACLALGGCSPGTPPTGPYAKWLKRNESVLGVKQEGPFTILEVEWRSHIGGSLAPLPHSSQRVLWHDREVVRSARDIERWTGIDRVVLLADVATEYSHEPHIIYERAGGPVAERLEVGQTGLQGEAGYGHGYPIDPHTRYLPKSMSGGGFLLDARTLKLRELPDGVRRNATPTIGALAGLSPDGKSVAYADARDSPSVLIVIDQDGQQREPLPVPVGKPAADRERDLSPYSPLLRWFAADYRWEKNAAGRWDIRPAVRHAAVAQPVEELFLDAQAGYRTCFASGNTACASGWRRPAESEAQAIFDWSPAFAYVPEKPVQAFGGNVTALWFRNATFASGYQLLSTAPPAALAAELARRLAARGIPFVRSEQCLQKNGRANCTALVKDKFAWQGQLGAYIDSTIGYIEPGTTLFVTPTAILGIAGNDKGGSYLQTVARYGSAGPVYRNE